ncbi:MAG: ABC transporter permease subunit [Candidatus Aminicenantes bacterium]|nr:ABC transporter permease subunit [Candidatus Aminicenantes bacterium]NIM83361.1 ABC transporter permease subunit [Candidatus Aminicenantes bacterium]NIN22725.1 ABC transporter permease subunit [Candidatus Aminicenantes bacterium]NIN46485.1 ABC transporter permease subunit [Candidatus Aminicenantes bacterium]NIN89367.1 ABC transporter permease subunit [Candidatus Aminicenantes bacterium]
MTIREKGYHSWDGELKKTGIQWLPMFFNGIKTVFRKRFSKIVFAFSVMPFLVFLLATYVSTRPELNMMKRMVRMLDNEAQFFNVFLTNGWMIFTLVVLGAYFGAELISGDIKFNSFPLYFSRPIDRKDYIFGKFSIVLFYFYLFSGAAAILLYIFKIIFTGTLSIGFYTLLGLIVVPFLVAFYLASIVLLVSSISRNTRYVKITIFLIYFMSFPIARLLINVFDSKYFYLVSIHWTIEQLGGFVFNTGARYPYPGWLSLVVVIAVSLGACLLLYRRIGKLEGQIESSN